MNAQAIREETARVSETLAQHPEARSIFGVLGEIAAQAAETNEHLAKIANFEVKAAYDENTPPGKCAADITMNLLRHQVIRGSETANMAMAIIKYGIEQFLEAKKNPSKEDNGNAR